MKKAKLGTNAVLNVTRNILNLIFPLITFPYVSRVLGVTHIGQYNFASSVVSYFVLLAGLGINSYAVREGAGIREDKKKASAFFSEVYTLNIITTVISYILLFLCLTFVKTLDGYKELILIFGLQIAFTTVGVEWIYSLYEEYAYITARTIAFKLISMALLFAFVRDENDVNAYAAITVFSTVGSNVLNFVHSRTYWTYRIKKWRDVCKHLKSILIMFASSVAVSIYVYSDTTMLGFMKTDYEVGLYAVSSRVYTILKSIISSLLIVTIPRLSFYYANGDRKQFDDTVQKIMDSITVLLLPSVVGVFMLSRNIVLIVGGDAYAEAAISLRILSIALLFSLYGWIYNECVLLPTRNEKIISYATWASALANIGLNIALIPKWGQNAAAFTTVVAELIVMAICYRYGKGYGTFKILNRTFFTSIIGCAEIMLVCVVVPFLIPNMMISTCVCITISAVVYAVTLLMLKNQVALKLFYRLMKIVQTIGIKKNKIEENA